MEKGFLKADSAIGWYKDCLSSTFRPSEGDVLIKYQGVKDFFKYIHFDAYICKDCKLVCFEYPPYDKVPL